MEEFSSKIKVLLVGPYPPPYGGIAVQIYEWKQLLSKSGNYECEILNIGESRTSNIPGCISVGGYWDFVKKLHAYASRGYVIHLVTNGHNLKSWLSSLACAVVGSLHGGRTVLVFGSGNTPDYVNNAGFFVSLLIRGSVTLGRKLVCRNEQMQQALERAGSTSEKIYIIPGFLGVDSICHEVIPEPIKSFLETHRPLLGATASLAPEYGIPLMMEAVEELKRTYPNIGLLIMGPDAGAASQVQGMERIPPNVLFTGPVPHSVALSVMKKLTSFLRPTLFDGDSISVRESLALGVPVVASDTGFRPAGVVLFKPGEAKDFLEKVEMALEHRGALSPPPGGNAPSHNADRLMRIYSELTVETK